MAGEPHYGEGSALKALKATADYDECPDPLKALREQRAALHEIAMRKQWLAETMKLIAAEEAADYDECPDP
jgi:hypothetical protein